MCFMQLNQCPTSCTDTCNDGWYWRNSDGSCDDGGPGAEYASLGQRLPARLGLHRLRPAPNFQPAAACTVDRPTPRLWHNHFTKRDVPGDHGDRGDLRP